MNDTEERMLLLLSGKFLVECSNDCRKTRCLFQIDTETTKNDCLVYLFNKAIHKYRESKSDLNTSGESSAQTKKDV